MTTDPHDEHGEILRRALHAEADTVNPAGDGLERIRARVADGQSRRFGLGRFGPARFGLDRFTVGWARPVLAVAAAVVIAGLGVTAPQTIDLIQQSVGTSRPSGGGQNNTDGDRASTPGNPEFPEPPAAGSSSSGAPSASSTTIPSSSPGLSSCRIPPPAGTAPASPGATDTPTQPTTPCPSETPTTAPTSPPPSTPTTSPTSQPTDAPTQAPTSPAAGTGEEGPATTP